MSTKTKESLRIVSQEEIGKGIFSMWLQADRMAEAARPGQFLSLYTRNGSKLLPRPISICEIDRENGRIRIVYRVAGKGTEVGRSFEELRAILDRVELKEKMGVCLDTCHVWDGGYDIVDHLDEVLEEFDRVLGLDQIAVFHINDSKNPCGAAKDRHENIGFGNIGFETLKEIVYMKEFENIPKILETPYIKDPDNDKKSYAPYKFEIEMLKQRELNPNLQKEVIENE